MGTAAKVLTQLDLDITHLIRLGNELSTKRITAPILSEENEPNASAQHKHRRDQAIIDPSNSEAEYWIPSTHDHPTGDDYCWAARVLFTHMNLCACV